MTWNAVFYQSCLFSSFNCLSYCYQLSPYQNRSKTYLTLTYPVPGAFEEITEEEIE